MSASRPEAQAPENITKKGRQNEVEIAPAAPQIAQITEQPLTINMATTRGNVPTQEDEDDLHKNEHHFQ